MKARADWDGLWAKVDRIYAEGEEAAAKAGLVGPGFELLPYARQAAEYGERFWKSAKGGLDNMFYLWDDDYHGGR